MSSAETYTGPRYVVLVGAPSSGHIRESNTSWLASFRHKTHRLPSCNSGPNFNNVLVSGLNYARKKQITHLALCHADIDVIEDEEECRDCKGKGCVACCQRGVRVYVRWLDKMIEEMDKVGADFISTPMAIKDDRGLTSCGIGNPDNKWNVWRRFCTNEFRYMPTTFSAEMIGYADKYLIHNHALCVWDLRKPIWQTTRPDGKGCRAVFNYNEDVELNAKTDQWETKIDSEDWSYSRGLWEMGAKTFISSRVLVRHFGEIGFRNKRNTPLSFQLGDENTASQWRTPELLAELKTRLDVSLDVFGACVQAVMATKKEPLTFVQIGAHDGKTLDPVRPFIDMYGWKGVVVEPHPTNFQRLVEGYKGRQGIAFEQAAVLDHDGETSLFAFEERADLPYFSTMLASTSRSMLEGNSHGFEGKALEIRVPAMKVETLFTKHQVKQLDVLVVDTEGLDFEIVEAVMRSGVLPTLIHFENAGRTDLMPEGLKKNGYAIQQLGVDIIAYRQTDLSRCMDRQFMRQEELNRLVEPLARIGARAPEPARRLEPATVDKLSLATLELVDDMNMRGVIMGEQASLDQQLQQAKEQMAAGQAMIDEARTKMTAIHGAQAMNAHLLAKIDAMPQNAQAPTDYELEKAKLLGFIRAVKNGTVKPDELSIGDNGKVGLMPLRNGA